VRDSGFDTHTRQRTLPEPTDLTDTIWKAAVELVRPHTRGMTVRLLGVAATHLTDRQQLVLFGGDERQERATKATDAIRKKFGSKAITRARLLEADIAEPFERDHLHAPEAPRVGRARPPIDPDD